MFSCFLYKGERLILAIWVGGLLSIGYIAVPILFNTLDSKQLAGQLAGEMFSVMNVISFICGALLFATALFLKQGAWFKERRVWVLVVMLSFVVASVVLQPLMQELKAGGLIPGSEEAKAFGRMHGVSSVLYLINSLLGIYLVTMARPVKGVLS